MKHFPFIDDRVHHLPIGTFRRLVGDGLPNLLPDNLYVITKRNEPVAVVMHFVTFMHLQQLLKVPGGNA